MNTLAIFGTQLTLSLLVYALLAKWYVAPWLADKPLEQVLTALIFPHALRHLGLVFLADGVAEQTLPQAFAAAAAYGDFVSGLLAIGCLFALRAGWTLALPLVWIFNITGTADLLFALSHAEAVPSLGATWFIPTFFVPLLLVTHVMIFARLFKQSPQQVAAISS